MAPGQQAKTDSSFCRSPIFHNHFLLIEGKPIICPQWSDKGVYSIQDIMGLQGLCEFQDLQKSYSLPGNSFLFSLQLRVAMRAHGVPWGALLEKHPLHEVLVKNTNNNGLISVQYKYSFSQAFFFFQMTTLLSSRDGLAYALALSNIGIQKCKTSDDKLQRYSKILSSSSKTPSNEVQR